MPILSQPPKSGTRIGAILCGLSLGTGAFIGVVFSSVLTGALIAWLFDSYGWTGLGEYKPWLPIAFGEYSILPGIVVGAVVCWKTWKSSFVGQGNDIA